MRVFLTERGFKSLGGVNFKMIGNIKRESFRIFWHCATSWEPTFHIVFGKKFPPKFTIFGYLNLFVKETGLQNLSVISSIFLSVKLISLENRRNHLRLCVCVCVEFS